MRLVARNTNTLILAEIQRVTGDARINTEDPIEEVPNHPHLINWAGSIETNLDSSEPLTAHGEGLYLGEDNQAHLAGDLEILHEDGTREQYEGYIEKPLGRLPGGQDAYAVRALTALKYAEWIIHSTHALENNEIDTITHARIQQRAREYAQMAGIELLVDAVIAATTL